MQKTESVEAVIFIEGETRLGFSRGDPCTQY
jgi:hypothetical protein